MRSMTRLGQAALVGFGLALAWCVLAGSCVTDAQAVDQAQVPVTCRVLPALEATFHAAVNLGDLVAGAPHAVSPPQIVSVRSNAPWALTIKSDSADGRLREWTGAAYATPDPRALSWPLEWKHQDSSEFSAISGTETTVVSDMPATGSAGSSVSIVFRQSATYDDEVLQDQAHTYRVEVTYSVTHTY